MTDEPRGEKRLCLNCAAKFFDLAKEPIKCPKCGATFEPVLLARSPPRRIGRPFSPQPFEHQGAVVEAAEEGVKASDGEHNEDEGEKLAENDAAV
ncbi:TIGR02300 family protein [Rhodoblastus sphagnicola]|uniref:TIGR02300 family protein n=1 Tax=Rhodoblastus sphagnicola TaxID=333368 RepID=A0A2S6NH71_9HYPH|nr:TIGR02300 family protein [Rhodoblastus sphagnicola]PPQ33953.1 TIGR02300 family protein [Rhodoblastus sphagnicola]